MFLLNICQPADIILLKSFLNNWKVGVLIQNNIWQVDLSENGSS